MVRFAQGNDFASAARLHRKLYPLFKALFVEPSPAPIKAALARAHIIGSEAVRLPLCPVGTATRAVLAKAMSGLRR
jgi:4-hydroxy-tetrahydrodipicolinate synthase